MMSEEFHPLPRYVSEYMAAIDRTEGFGLQAPPRILVAKDCVDLDRAMPALLEYFDRHRPEELVAQTSAINFALVPLLLKATGIPFQLTIGWCARNGKPIFQHGDDTIRRLLAEKLDAWVRKGVPFHLWLTSPACEILDVTFAMNLGWARNREECARRVIYQSAHAGHSEPIYHPTLVGPDFFWKTGAVIWATMICVKDSFANGGCFLASVSYSWRINSWGSLSGRALKLLDCMSR
jgi:hypothetical protein